MPKIDFEKDELGETYNSLVAFRKRLYEIIEEEGKNAGNLNRIRETSARIDVVNRAMLKLGKLVESSEDTVGPPAIDDKILLRLPDHLRKTIVEVSKLGRANATDIAEYTHRARAVESLYLNQLVIMRHLSKERQGRKVYFLLAKT